MWEYAFYKSLKIVVPRRIDWCMHFSSVSWFQHGTAYRKSCLVCDTLLWKPTSQIGSSLGCTYVFRRMFYQSQQSFQYHQLELEDRATPPHIFLLRSYCNQWLYYSSSPLLQYFLLWMVEEHYSPIREGTTFISYVFPHWHSLHAFLAWASPIHVSVDVFFYTWHASSFYIVSLLLWKKIHAFLQTKVVICSTCYYGNTNEYICGLWVDKINKIFKL